VIERSGTDNILFLIKITIYNKDKDMGLISSTHSISRYHIDGKIEGSLTEIVRNGLIKHSIPKIESEYDEISAGWTPVESPYNPDFDKTHTLQKGDLRKGTEYYYQVTLINEDGSFVKKNGDFFVGE